MAPLRSNNPMRPASRADDVPLADRHIFDSILKAISEQRLPPGTKLGEVPLAEAFEVSRSRIKRVLQALAQRGIVDLIHNRGAFVAKPTADEARDVFSVRGFLENLVVERVTNRLLEPSALKALRAHVRAETAAQADRTQQREALRLAGEFHLLLAELSGSRVFQSMMEPLVMQNSLIVGLFGKNASASCQAADHAAIVEAIAEKDLERAQMLMSKHLKELEDALELEGLEEPDIDLGALFGQKS